MSFTLRVVDLEVYYRLGVGDEERAEPQRLMVTVEMEVDAPRAAASDDLRDTVDYFEVSQAVLRFGEGRSWKLLEKLSVDLAEMIRAQYHPVQVKVEIKKFIIPEARHVSVSCTRSGAGPA